jgi:hypothetical protein
MPAAQVRARLRNLLALLKRCVAFAFIGVVLLGAGYVVLNPGETGGLNVYVGRWRLHLPGSMSFERRDTGEYRLLLDQKSNIHVSKRAQAIVASRGLLQDVPAADLVDRVAGTGWFAPQTRVCLLDKPVTGSRGERWAVQYYQQTLYNLGGIAFRNRHGILMVRSRRDSGAVVFDVSDLDRAAGGPGAWQSVRDSLRLLLQRTHPSQNQRGSLLDAARERLTRQRDDQQRPAAAELGALGAPPPAATPLCLGPRQLHFDGQNSPTIEPRKDGVYRLRWHDQPFTADVGYRLKPLQGRDAVGFNAVRTGWLDDDQCARGLGEPAHLFNRLGSWQRYVRIAGGLRYVGVMAVVKFKSSDTVIFDVYDPRPTPLGGGDGWPALQAQLQMLKRLTFPNGNVAAAAPRELKPQLAIGVRCATPQREGTVAAASANP